MAEWRGSDDSKLEVMSNLRWSGASYLLNEYHFDDRIFDGNHSLDLALDNQVLD